MHITRLALMSLLLGGCATFGHRGGFPSDDRVRPATDLPARFEVVPANPPTSAAPIPGACRSPLADPRDGRRLTLVRSMEGRGDYTVPPGAYGARGDERLRVDCQTLVARGLVPA